MLSRKVVTRRGRRIRGYFPSGKLGRMVAWESLLERDAIYLLEFSPGVVSYQEQPAIVRYFDGSQLRDYYPDFRLVLNDGSEFHLEVKPESKLARPPVRARMEAIAAHYAQQGRKFRIATEREIRREPLLANVRMLTYLRDGRGHVLPSVAELAKVFEADTVPFSTIEAVLGRETVLRLLAASRLSCDLTRMLSSDTPVALTHGGRDAAVLL